MTTPKDEIRNDLQWILDVLEQEYGVNHPEEADALLAELAAEWHMGQRIPEPRRTILIGWQNTLKELLNIEQELADMEQTMVQVKKNRKDIRLRSSALYEATKLFGGEQT